ncbi:MAG: hypothetical protein ACK5QT_08500 [Oligoflexia bacterium]
MSLKVAIFEDDKELADLLKERMEDRHFEVVNYYSLLDSSWQSSDIVLADFRNKIVPFSEVVDLARQTHLPVIAISGAETQFRPQLLKPFLIDDLEGFVLKVLRDAGPRTGTVKEKNQKKNSQKKNNVHPRGLLSIFKLTS